MQKFAHSAVGLISLAAAQNVLVTDAGVAPYSNGFGMSVEEITSSNNSLGRSQYVTEKVIKAPLIPIHLDYEQQEKFLNRGTEFHQNLDQNAATTYVCDNREPEDAKSWLFMPVLAADVSEANPTATYSGKCFDEITFEFAKTSDTTFDVTVTTDKPKDFFCNDTILFGNTEIQHFEAFYFKGAHKLSFEMTTPEAQADVKFGGIKAFAFCDNIVKELESLFLFVKSFAGGLTPHPKWPWIGSHVPPYMEKAVIEFLSETMGLNMETREIQKVEIDPDLIQSGDYIAVMRLEGLSAMIMYGTGSHTSHSLMALRFDGELYIVESQGGTFWPIQGIQRHKWADWVQLAENCDMNVGWLPLTPENREKFDEKAAQDFFFQTEGLPYGYHNFMYGWVNSATGNWPPLMPNELVPVAFALFDKLEPVKADMLFTQALNKRLGTVGKSIQEIAEIAAGMNMEIEDVMAMPEQDGWLYTGEEPRDGLSYVCSAYVAAMYKVGGLFGDFEVNATEFLPSDIYQLDIFDADYALPEACTTADPGNQWCQITGKYRLTLPGYNSVAPYSHMNEKCTINWPEYTRDDGC